MEPNSIEHLDVDWTPATERNLSRSGPTAALEAEISDVTERVITDFLTALLHRAYRTALALAALAALLVVSSVRGRA